MAPKTTYDVMCKQRIQFAFQQMAKFLTILLLIIKPYFGTLVSFSHFCPSSLPLSLECSPIWGVGATPPSRTPMLGDVLMIIFHFLIENCCKGRFCGQGPIPGVGGGGGILNIIYNRLQVLLLAPLEVYDLLYALSWFKL